MLDHHEEIFAVGFLEESFTVCLEIDDLDFDVALDETLQIVDPSTLPKYHGPYSVLSSFDGDQILDTKDKYLTGDITVEQIPVHSVSNESGGNTVYIGVKLDG